MTKFKIGDKVIEPRDERAETIAYIKGKLEKAEADWQKNEDAAKEARQRRDDAWERIEEFKRQINALESLKSPRPKDELRPGDKVIILDPGSQFSPKWTGPFAGQPQIVKEVFPTGKFRIEGHFSYVTYGLWKRA